MITRRGNTIYLTCPTCKARHIFIPVMYGEYELYSIQVEGYKRIFDEERFILHGNMLVPMFVCRNLKCDFETNVRL